MQCNEQRSELPYGLKVINGFFYNKYIKVHGGDHLS